ncbi:hypothetical protein JNW91_00590 [Micromonospora sp. STR1_7]|uniref:Uncharacterized protein n=1 Tax=Micromonospora parastrephiae TaxID=2806101 RepID=A0ABS1XMQ8_9ACTN|nr:hypothetical protein [Micromonospora parastrephiae]MBM0230499.1 hypothetical protein [Micromonospora parastrephiae]
MVEQRFDTFVMIDGRRLVAVSHRCPPGTVRDLWNVRVNGRAIGHRTFPHEVPHSVEVISRSVWRHLHGIAVDDCDTPGCHGTATMATWGHQSWCHTCAKRFALTGQ